MNFTLRSQNLAGTHAFLSPSKPSWVNYEDDKLDRVFYAHQEAKRGTELHAFAHEAIRLGQRLLDVPKTINMYVNDGIGYRMTSEQLLFYSMNCYGHADTISFRNNKLRIHDLKTGVTAASMMQLLIYVALFCLEYNFKPMDIEIELRIYQNDEVKVYVPTPDEIFHIIDRIITFDKRINYLRSEENS